MTVWDITVGCFTADLWNYFTPPGPDTTLPSTGIEQLIFDDESETLVHRGEVAGGLRSPQYLATHPTLPVVYAAEFSEPGALVAFEVASDGTLRRQSSAPTGGEMPVGICVHSSGRCAYVAHLGDGVLSRVELGNTGAITEARRVGVPPPGASLHQVRLALPEDHLVATDYRRDEVTTYSVDLEGQIGEKPLTTMSFPPGSGPRHIEWHQSGEQMYMVTEFSAQLYSLAASNFVPVEIEAAMTVVPETYDGARGDAMPSELVLHPETQTLYVAVRRADRIVAFDIAGGMPRRLGDWSAGGRSPRGLCLLPTGRHLLVGNWHSNDVVALRVEPDGSLELVAGPVTTNSPSSVVVRRSSDPAKEGARVSQGLD